ncbi:hypothetical protein PIROE2DRAFT_19041 [Piromyces sp. E2]|nr:hypothetical protein PIROE2DRAFT_19041 [Piromyces sp. E2]|eukprot:OUM56373.1 hypothetical protein PIROE2DRAFT_19041 [Piromyces sp. E2]
MITFLALENVPFSTFISHALFKSIIPKDGNFAAYPEVSYLSTDSILYVIIYII